MTFSAELEARGLIHDKTPGVERWLDSPGNVAYCGFDPTASSLHVGSLLPLTMLARLQRAGHAPIALMGGGTGMIGDPSGKTKERQLLTREQVAANVDAIKKQAERVLDFRGARAAKIIDNADWLLPITAVEFLRDVGKHFTVNAMCAKDSVKRRLESETGISFTEFSYMLLQAYDFLRLFENERCTMQVGGSDQWGNITAGLDLIRSKHGADLPTCGLTFPLIASASGVKFGKTEAGAVWLDEKQTSCFAFFQFWLNTDDRDVVRYLKFFTFLPLEQIDALAAEHERDPARRVAHQTLATELTRLMHGESGLAKARRATEVFFGAEITPEMDVRELAEVFAEVPSGAVAKDAIAAGIAVADFLVAGGAAPSKKEAKRLIESGGVSLNNRRVESAERTVTASDAIGGALVVVRKGKKNYHLVRVTA